MPTATPAFSQRKALINKFIQNISTSFNDVRPYSVAFCETIVDFIKNQPEKVHSAIRLAKF
jgi:hypothetical protein